MDATSSASFELRLAIRSTALAKLSLDRVVAGLRAGGVRFRGKRVTQESVINASWLMLGQMDDQAVERALTPHLASLEGTAIPSS